MFLVHVRQRVDLGNKHRLLGPHRTPLHSTNRNPGDHVRTHRETLTSTQKSVK